MNVPWLPVTGRGSHIKATPNELIIQQKSEIKRYPIREVRHLLIAGSHYLDTSAVIQLLRAGGAISFFDLDCTPVGYLYPYGYTVPEEVRGAQMRISAHRYAVTIVRGAMKTRLLFLERLAEERSCSLFYEGELDFLHRAEREVEFLVRMEEVRRIQRLSSDMYYEILSRALPVELGFRRRTERPHRDPVNAIFSFGYSMLFGAGCMAVVGAHLDPDLGVLSEGSGGLVQDLIEPLKPHMVDAALIALACEGIQSYEFDLDGGTRCYLSEDMVNRIAARLHSTIDQTAIDTHVRSFRDALLTGTDFILSY